jgi:hypothetical protein
MKRARTSPKVLREDIKALQANPAGLRSVHLLPYFDVYLLAHSTKEHFLDARFLQTRLP